ncbi:hypothetical protein H310_09354 [Aphanomyces invadans]|uniref:Transposase Tc1-like domain-containing protein n=1 Tax=Aphanomyces invadans TaxID=157072 RepID=A0A024TV60_9STRA|nr:hypothetical protein H310_09354 [Aphanomyces invadans]ETV98065.1 hypothetical protein H310_09354 [Aphanomyces invadans]|eukprot:XP_008873626.1 hypothetical protein H310_09354 [Aphanomyces invadans]
MCRREKKGNCSHKRTTILADLEASVKAADPYHRSAFRALAESTGIATTTLRRLVEAKKIRRRTSRVKPMLTDKHKAERFFVTQVNRRYYLLQDEDFPVRKCQSKRHITKFMFLTAVARSHFCGKCEGMLDGKIAKDVYRQYHIEHVIPNFLTSLQLQTADEERHFVQLGHLLDIRAQAPELLDIHHNVLAVSLMQLKELIAQPLL